MYIDMINSCADVSMIKAVEDVKSIPGYEESVITDVRHDSTSNAYHTTVACLSRR